MGFIFNFVSGFIGDLIKSIFIDFILGKVASFIKLLAVLSAVFTLVGIIGFKVTMGNAGAELQTLISAGDNVAVAEIIDNVRLFATFIRVGTLLMLIFALIVLIINFIVSLNPAGSIIGLIITITGFVLSFQLSVYCSVSKVTEAGVTNLITPDAVQGMVYVNIIMGIAIAELLLAFIGMFKIE